jgi:Tfp pilus assembly protein PilV
MRLPNKSRVRPGLSLLEVLIAVAVFLLAIGGIGQLVSMAGDRAVEVQQRNQASRLCQTVMARYQCGDRPMNSQGDTPFDEDPDYVWSSTLNQGAPNQSSVNGLWTVTITVTRNRPSGDPIECTLTQLVIDPTIVGSNQDVTPIAGSDQSGATGTTGSTGATDPTGAGAAPGGAAPAKGGAPQGNTGAGNKSPTPAPGTGAKSNAPAPAPASNTKPATGGKGP